MDNIKIYNQRIDYKDVNNMYIKKEKSCMDILKYNFKNRCYKGAYIIDIISIEKISDVEISRNHTDARAFVDVIFKAHVIQRMENDLIAKCKIIKQKGNKTFAKIDYGDVILTNHDLLKIVNKNDIIPIIVIKSRCTVLNNSISVFATPYVPSIPNNTNIYIIEGKMNNIELEKIKTYKTHLINLKNWMKKLNTNDAKKFVAFDNMFYPYTKPRKPKLLENKKISVVDITQINFESINNILLIQSPEIIKSKLFVLSANLTELSSVKKTVDKHILNYKYITERSYLVFELLFIKYIKYLSFIKDMIQEHNYPKESNIYWKSLKEYKI